MAFVSFSAARSIVVARSANTTPRAAWSSERTATRVRSAVPASERHPPLKHRQQLPDSVSI